MNERDNLIINNLRMLAIDMIDNASSGHPGIALGAAPIIYTLYSRHMNISTRDTSWINRDRFIMSAGHGSALLYANNYLCGYDLTIDDLKKFRQINSKTPGHPELGVTPGVDMSTGPLGQGIASAVGIALGEAYLRNKYVLSSETILEKKDYLFDFYTYVLAGDGDIMEGVTYEACSLAGHFGLGKLIILYDSNNVTLDGNSSKSTSEDIKKRFEAMNFHYQLVEDSENIINIDDAIYNAKDVKNKPSIIEIKTTIGKYSSQEGTNLVHGKPLSKSDVRSLRKIFGMSEPFVVNPLALTYYKEMMYERINKKFIAWNDLYNNYIKNSNQTIKNEIEELETGKIKIDFSNFTLGSIFENTETMRETNERVLNYISEFISNFIGGSADVSSSTKTLIKNGGAFSKENYVGRNIFYGVREHAMGCISNGLATLNLKVFASTFLSFSDYLKPAIRMSALMNLPVTYIFTHDSINIGEDGPTHAPIEQIDSLRLIPNLDVYRPCDSKEIVGCWDNILKSKKPSALILSKQVTPNINNTNSNFVRFGAYPIIVEDQVLHAIIIATGLEVKTAVEIANNLKAKKINVRVVSMPNHKLFLNQSVDYKNKLLPSNVKTFVLEASSAITLSQFASNINYLYNIDKFSVSGKSEDVLKYFNYDIESLTNNIERMILSNGK